MTTPMRQQYLSIKSQYPDCILLFRLGDFYETFDEDARIVARVCDVVLTSRPVGADQRVPLAGVPYHSVDYYIAKLVNAGYRVAIAEQVSEPGKGLVEREVRRVVTKGTLVDPGMLDERRNNYLIAVVMGRRGATAGIAYCDISTGEFAATQISAPSQEEVERRIGEEISRLQPSELIHIDWEPQHSSLHGLIALHHPLLTTLEAWRVSLETAEASLKRHFGVATLDGYGLQGKPEAIRAAAAVLAYVGDMQPGACAQLTRLSTYTLDAFMTLDEATRRNLELTETMRSGEVEGSLLGVLNATLTPMGSRLLRRWINQPLLDVAAINRRLDAVQRFVDDTLLRLDLRALLQNFGDLERWTNRVMQGIALPRDLVGIREALRLAPKVAERLGNWQRAHEDSGTTDFPLCADILALLESALVDDPPANLSTPGLIRPGFDAELDSLVERSRHAREWIAGLEQVERERLGIKNLKVGYNKVFGYYIEVTKSQLDRVPDSYIRKQTIANGERYITPELKEYETLVLNADERRLEIEQRLFGEICAQVAAQGTRLLHLAHLLAEIDVFATLAEVALTRRYVRPEVDEGPCIEIVAGRHPVVEMTLTDEPFVPNDTLLTPETAIQIITGPNMSGKSTYLRQTALITLMAQIGSFVPAERARIGVVDRIFTRLGASDEIHRGQSTFMVEMVETANILHHATPRSLLLLDEIGRGTSTYDGLAIAWAVIEYIHNHPRLRAKTLFATHYHELTDLAERLPHVVNYNVAVDDSGDGEDVVFLRRIIPGKADRSYGVHVARMAGLPAQVVARAEEILADLERSGAAGPRRLAEAVAPKRRAGAVQVSLFADVHPVVEALRKLDINNLTPLDALNRLYELQKMAGEG
ncbi:DNA mismatch repair protein MutS [Caldilinea sp.]|jgi:DNA mismatch repair protein MutS|uniref:DNA mismatch repair protein MutS n=1 Tax=Caldilinea sp. TaxID=2293560 RepID=UPI001B272382|nr:DNA mismatch repair protein MutS [Caldilinea sp.]MBO9392113.1 DNA mismatch repair protein MutS [Caldilinea sp.]